MIKWCFSTLGCTERSFPEIISLAERYGISALEVRGIGGQLQNEKIADFSKERGPATKEMLAKAKITPLILGTSVSFHDEGKYVENLSAGKNALAIASRVGFRAIRIFGNSIVGDEASCIRRVASGVAELCHSAESAGISVLLEVHGDFNTVERILPIAEYCKDFKSFGIIWDICHTHKAYGKKWKEFYDPLSPYIRHVHLKDSKDGKHVLPGEGELPILDVVEYLINEGYDGYFSLEWERYWRKELPEIERALESLLSLFRRT